MKTRLFSILLLFSFIHFNSVRAQTTFAPPGCEWYNAIGTSGVFHAYYVGDTNILGINSRIVVREANTLPSVGYSFRDLPTLYFYNNADTVFVYNYIFNRFTPVYVFNVHDGDTVSLPILPADPEVVRHIYEDSTFSFVVDSVRMVLYDTALLKTVYARPLYVYEATFGSKHAYDYGRLSPFSSADSNGAYAERIGGMAGLLPGCLACINLLDDRDVPQGPINCYNDSTLAVHLVSGMCGIPPPTTINTIEEWMPISIFPDPAFGFITITHIPISKNIAVKVTDMQGRQVMELLDNTNKSDAEMNVSQLASGMYMLKINVDNDTPVFRKIAVLH